MVALPKQYSRSPEYFAALDGFRGLLALCVAVYHTIWLSNINSTAFFNNGSVIIDLFFVFSGFLMYRLYGRKINSLAESGTFLKRRLARIYPIHFFMTIIFLGYGILRIIAHKVGISTYEVGEILPFQAGAQDGWGSLFSNLTLTHSMGVHESLTFNPPSWTISVEFFAYFTFAALLMCLPPKKAWHFGVLAVFIGVIYALLSRYKPNMDITYDMGFWRCMAGFYTGVIGAWAYRRLKARDEDANRTINTRFWTGLECLTLAGSMAFVIYCPGKLQFFVAPVAFAFVYIFAFDRGLISRFMSQKLFRYFAKISYSVYMIHVIISIFFDVFAKHFLASLIGENWNQTGLGGDLYILLYLCVVIVCAHITYHLIEVPGRKLINKIDIARLLGRQKQSAVL